MMSGHESTDNTVTQFHLAQLNIAELKFALDTPEMFEFVDNLERINALADHSPGFVWRLRGEQGDATSIDYFGPDYLVNMSVWESVEALHDYVYRSVHNQLMARRKLWFETMSQFYSVLWWIPAGEIPTMEQADERLQLLRDQGPGPRAFSFKQRFDPV